MSCAADGGVGARVQVMVDEMAYLALERCFRRAALVQLWWMA